MKIAPGSGTEKEHSILTPLLARKGGGVGMPGRIGRALMIVTIGSLLSCGGGTGSVFGQVETKLGDSHTQIFSTDNTGKTGLLGGFPRFPGLDPANPRVGENLVRFSNGNALVRVPDVSVTKKIRAWNDLSHLFDVLFVHAREKSLDILVRDTGFNIRIVKSANDETGFVFQISEDTCILRVLDDAGRIQGHLQYQFRAFPSLVSVSKTISGYVIVHSTIDGEEKFVLERSGWKIEPVSFSQTEEKGKH